MQMSSRLLSVEKLKSKLEQDAQFQRYRELGNKVHENKKLLTLYERYIGLQKELVNLNHYKKVEATLIKEAEMKLLEDQLFNNPLFNEYIHLQIELEELLQTMAHLIQEGVNEAIKS